MTEETKIPASGRRFTALVEEPMRREAHEIMGRPSDMIDASLLEGDVLTLVYEPHTVSAGPAFPGKRYRQVRVATYAVDAVEGEDRLRPLSSTVLRSWVVREPVPSEED